MKYGITPETKYLGTNELSLLVGCRDAMGWDMYPLTYEEYSKEFYNNGLILYNIKPHLIIK